MSEKLIIRENDDRINELEEAMVNQLELINLPLVHRFTKGMYIREIFMPKDALVTSKVHLTQHPYTISKGKAAVCIDSGEWVELEAPFTDITIPGTRRVLFILDDCTWTTYHALDFITGEEMEWSEEKQLELVEKIENLILDDYVNPLVDYNKVKLLTLK